MFLITTVSLFLINLCFADGDVENAIGKAMSDLRMRLKSSEVSLPQGTTTALVAIKRGGKRDMDAERKASAELWKVANEFKFILLDREHVNERLRELDMSVSDLVDPENAPRIGRFLGAFYLFVGEITRKGKERELSFDLIETETGAVRWKKLVKWYPHKVPAVSAGLSLMLPGSGQMMNESPGKSLIFLSIASSLATAALLYHSRYTEAHDRYLKATNIDDINRYYDESRAPYKLRNLFLGLYALCALVSSAEAYSEARWCETQRRRIELSISPEGETTISLRGDW